MSEKLKPCHRCQGSNLRIEARALNFDLGFRGIVTCLDCGEEVRSKAAKGQRAEEITRTESIAAWNQRAPVSKAMVEAAARVIDPHHYNWDNGIDTPQKQYFRNKARAALEAALAAKDDSDA